MKTRAAFCLGIFLATATMFAAQETPAPASTACGTSATISVNWAQFGFDPCHSKFNPREVTIGRSNVSNLVVAWKYATGGPINSYPTIFNGVVYVGSNDGFLYAINAATGALLWSYSIGNEFVRQPSAMDWCSLPPIKAFSTHSMPARDNWYGHIQEQTHRPW